MAWHGMAWQGMDTFMLQNYTKNIDLMIYSGILDTKIELYTF
jgi:hypothetical protein